MPRGFKAYFAIVTCYSILIFFGSLTMVMIVIPKLSQSNPGQEANILYFVATTMFICALLLVGTTVFMVTRQISLIPVSIQCMVLILTLYGIPIAVAGYLLLRAKGRRERDEASKVEAVLCPVCKTLPGDDAVQFGEVKVCAECKPQFEQRLREGVQ